MAKQKGGLGKGLDALFDSAEAEKTQAAQAEAEEAAVEPEAEAEVEVERTEVVPETEIYFTDEELENATVVEREPRKPSEKQDKKKKKKGSAKNSASSSFADEGAGEVGEVPIDNVVPNRNQPRSNFDEDGIKELASSIQREGLLSPILVHKVGDHYQIIAGERRWRACKSLGMQTVPVRFWDADSDKALELALIENIQRSDLTPIEEAWGYKRMMERAKMTQSEVAQAMSKGRSSIANSLRLLELPEEAQQLLHEGKITAGHARAILSIPDAEGRKKLTGKLVAENLSVREAEAVARLFAGKADDEAEARKRVPLPASYKRAARGLKTALSAPVRVTRVRGKNKIEIQFNDEEDLERIYTLISKKK